MTDFFCTNRMSRSQICPLFARVKNFLLTQQNVYNLVIQTPEGGSALRDSNSSFLRKQCSRMFHAILVLNRHYIT